MYCRFWSQIVYDKPLNASLVSFLQEAPRFYSEEKDVLKALPTAWKLFNETQNLVFLTFVRMATHKESKVLLFFAFITFFPICSFNQKCSNYYQLISRIATLALKFSGSWFMTTSSLIFQKWWTFVFCLDQPTQFYSVKCSRTFFLISPNISMTWKKLPKA